MMPDFGAEPIDPALARKLDAFTVPPLPTGFAERLAKHAASLPPEAHSAAPALRTRPSAPRRRWRMASTGLGAIALGMISISAAAMGYLGEPVREAIGKAPVVGPAIVRTIERVVPERLVVKRPQAEQPVLVANPESPIPVPATSEAAGDTPQVLPQAGERRRLLADPEARRAWMEAHPRAAGRIEARRAARREIVETHPRAAQIVAERRAAREAGASPREMRQLRREQIREVREQRADLRTGMKVDAPPAEPAARMAEPTAAEPAVDRPVMAASDAPIAGQGDQAQRRIERRERRQERRERIRQRLERNRP
jgi:hypothetical protein